MAAANHSNFGGKGPIPRENHTFTLDPAPFKEMVRTIRCHSRPDHQDSHETEQYVNDFNKLKNFAKGLIEVIAAYDISPTFAQTNLYKGVVNICLWKNF